MRFSFVDTSKVAEIEAAIEPATRLLWLETPSNPLLTITDIKASAAVGRARGVRVLVDNTFATPITQRPLELGADLDLDRALQAAAAVALTAAKESEAA